VLAVHPDYLLREKILDEMKRSWYDLSVQDEHHIIVGLIRDRQFEMAWERYESLQRHGHSPDIWLVNLLLYTMVSLSSWSEVEVLLQTRVVLGGRITPISSAMWSYLLSAAARAHHQRLIQKVWDSAVRPGYLNVSSGLCTSILEACANSGDTDLATDVFRVLGERSSNLLPWHYESLFESYVAAGDVEGAFSVLIIMQKSSTPPTDATIRPLFLYLRSEPEALSDAMKVLKSLRSADKSVPICAINAVIEAYVYADSLEEGIALYKESRTFCPTGPNTHTFNSLLRGCHPQGRKDIAMLLVTEMRALNVSPDALTYDRLIITCIRSGIKTDWQSAWLYFKEMRVRNWWPRRGTLKMIAQSCVNWRDGCLWELFEICEQADIDMHGLRGQMERYWIQQWGRYSLRKNHNNEALHSPEPDSADGRNEEVVSPV
jgi:pentatricopeptide repeat protein